MNAPTVEVTVSMAALGGPALAGAAVSATLSRTEVYGGLVVSLKERATTDEDGVAVLQLFPNAPAPTGLGTQGSTYSIYINVPGGKPLNLRARVPNTACNLHEILVADEIPPLDAASAAVLQVQGYVAEAGQALEDVEAVAASVSETSDAVALLAQQAAEGAETATDKASEAGQFALEAAGAAASSVVSNRGAWASGVAYAIRDIVVQTGVWYICVLPHTSAASFATDMATRWRVYQGTVQSEVPYTLATYAALRSYAGDASAVNISGYLASAAPSGIAGLFTRDDNDIVSADNGGTIIVAGSGKRWKRVYDGAANIRWFGAVGNGTTDDTAALTAAATLIRPVFVPAGKYKCSANLSPNSPWFGASKGNGNPGSAQDASYAQYTSEIYFVGTGWAVATAFDFKNISIRGATSISGQSGLRLLSPVGQKAGPCRIMEVDGTGCELGNSSASSGIYFADLSSVEINNRARVGACGFRIHGGGAASSNGNTVKGPFVSGAWTRCMHFAGHNNLILGGDIQPEGSLVASLGGSISEGLYVEGDGNTWLNPYFEPVGTMPPKLVRFAASASGNRLSRLYTPSSGGTIFALIEDLGTENEVSIVSIGENFTPSVGRAYSERNLVPNPGFQSASASSVPYGWQLGGGSTGAFSVDPTVTRGGLRTLKLITAGTRIQVDCFVASSVAVAVRGAISFVPLAALRGQTVSLGVWCLSATAGMGHLAAQNGGTTGLGAAAHSGSGQWEFLTVRTRIDAAANDVALRLRNSVGFQNNTGECWFSEPVLVIGNDVPRFGGSRALDSQDAALMGRLTLAAWATFSDGDATPDVSDRNLVKTANSGATTITQFDGAREGQMLWVRAGDGNTTIAHNGNIKTTTGANKLLTSGVIYKFVYDEANTDWVEL